MRLPLIGITTDHHTTASGNLRYESPPAYARAVAAAGGVPVLLPWEAALAADYVRRCDGFLFSGGDDVRMEEFGEPTHPAANVLAPGRQAFELALLRALDAVPDKPVLGVCLGIQIIAVHHGGKLHQHLPDVLGEAAAAHVKDHRHGVVFAAGDSVLGSAADEVPSWHHQAVRDPGRLRVVATAPDGIIEAIDNPARRFYVGVQWHPERGGVGALNGGVIERLVKAAGSPQ